MVLQTVRVPFGTVSRYSFECVDILAEGVDLQSEVLESLVIAVISRLSIHNTDRQCFLSFFSIPPSSSHLNALYADQISRLAVQCHSNSTFLLTTHNSNLWQLLQNHDLLID